MAALVAPRSNPALRATSERLRAHAKPAKLALVVIMRKMLVTLNAMLRTTTPWRHIAPAARARRLLSGTPRRRVLPTTGCPRLHCRTLSKSCARRRFVDE
jgi:hypothetical protein